MVSISQQSLTLWGRLKTFVDLCFAAEGCVSLRVCEARCDSGLRDPNKLNGLTFFNNWFEDLLVLVWIYKQSDKTLLWHSVARKSSQHVNLEPSGCCTLVVVEEADVTSNLQPGLHFPEATLSLS